jgi:hypothetical protein
VTGERAMSGDQPMAVAARPMIIIRSRSRHSDTVMTNIERRLAKEIGVKEYADLKKTGRRLAELPLKS